MSDASDSLSNCAASNTDANSEKTDGEFIFRSSSAPTPWHSLFNFPSSYHDLLLWRTSSAPLYLLFLLRAAIIRSTCTNLL